MAFSAGQGRGFGTCPNVFHRYARNAVPDTQQCQYSFLCYTREKYLKENSLLIKPNNFLKVLSNIFFFN